MSSLSPRVFLANYRRTPHGYKVTLWIALSLVTATIVFLIVFLTASSIISGHRETRFCTITSVVDATDAGQAPLADGKPSWKVATDCGGTLYIDPDATHQTATEAIALAQSLEIGREFRLSIQGSLLNPFTISAYLLAATPVG